ncbi:MAG: ATP-binding protein [Myxococcales bacterium]|nr:ATP-binding protein [Myxococcales bacterium]
MTPTPAQSDRFLARQMALGFGTVSVVAVVMCGMLLVTIYQVAALVDGMRGDESTIRRGLGLATAVRELSIHIAHTVIEGDASHLPHYETWRQRVRADLQELSPSIPEAERGRLERLGRQTQRMHDLLMASALPAARRGDMEAAREIHRELDGLGQGAAREADVLAHVASAQMVAAHVDATELTSAALLGGGLCVALVILLSIGFTLRLRAAVLRPLAALTAAARRVGRGDFDLRIGQVGRGELAALATAFDRMAEELKQREATVVRHARMAAVGQLAAGVAHELNNPIGIIRGYLKTMKPDGDAAALRDELAILDEEAGHCQRIAQDLLSYARAGDLSPTEVAIDPFLHETVARFRESPGGAGRLVRLEIERATLEADAQRLRQVVLNLLNNAAQASPSEAAVVVRGHRDGPEYLLEVEDQGPGVSQAERERIFEPFFSTRRGGSGLGLSVCLGIVRAHGGTIEVSHAAHGGAMFVVRLPLRQPSARKVHERSEVSQ